MRRMSLAASLMLGLAAATMPVMRAHAQVAVGISITIAPPVLPVYEQPPIPEVGYIWAPGYWAYSDVGYYWVPGTWVLPPQEGLLWTPGYWGYGDGGAYVWHAGYWGPHVGFYGGVNYGYGYGGNGYEGGYWQQNHFFYNRNVNNFGNTHITNVYERNVTNVTVNRISYNGGNGINARPSQQELSYQNEHHFDPTPDQRQQEHLAVSNRSLWASQNRGVPPIAATPRPAEFTAHGVVAAHNAPVNIPRPEHTSNMMTPQHSDQPHPVPGTAPHPENSMAPQHPEVMQHPQNAMPMQHENNMLAPQHAAQPAPHPVMPGNMGMNHPAEAPAVHQPAPQVVHPPMAPVMHEPAPQAYHPQQIQPAHPMEAPRPGPIPASHPEQPHAAPLHMEQPHPGGGQEHQEHKPN